MLTDGGNKVKTPKKYKKRGRNKGGVDGGEEGRMAVGEKRNADPMELDTTEIKGTKRPKNGEGADVSNTIVAGLAFQSCETQ